MTTATTTDTEALQSRAHLISPAHLMMADLGAKCMMPKHLWKLNYLLVKTLQTPNGRLALNMPFQHGKTMMSSNYGVSWRLLTKPDWRIIAIAFAQDWCENKIGAIVKGIVERWGPPLGIRLKRDTKAKGEWVIEGHGGGLVCCGRDGQIVGRPADAIFLDDLIKNNEEAMSPTMMDKAWSLYETVIFSRLGPTAPIVSVGTRWGRNDWFGRIKKDALLTGEKWEFVSWPALAKKDDPLGRKEGQALWPERVPQERLDGIAKKEGPWFNICWQQDTTEEDGKWLKPKFWPRYTDLGHSWSINRIGQPRRIVPKNECIILFAGDWAYSVRRKGDSSALVMGAITPPYLLDGNSDADLLILDALRIKVKPEGLAPECDRFCARWHPRYGGIEEGHPTLKDDVQRFPSIPQIQWLPPQGQDKLNRAFEAIIWGQRGRIILPEADQASGLEMPWMPVYCTQLAEFSGIDEGPDTDDLVDATSWLAKIGRQYRPAPQQSRTDYSDWAPLTPGRETGWKQHGW